MSGHRVGKHVKGPRLQNARIRVEHLTEAQIGYIAAFLDGEGGVQITMTFRKDRVYKTALHPCVYFTNTNQEAIQTIRSWLQAGCIVRIEPKGEGYRTGYALHITGIRNIVILLKRIRPYLIIKAKQADLMSRFCERRLAHYMGKERTYTENELSLYTALKALNKRGVKQRQPTEV